MFECMCASTAVIVGWDVPVSCCWFVCRCLDQCFLSQGDWCCVLLYTYTSYVNITRFLGSTGMACCVSDTVCLYSCIVPCLSAVSLGVDVYVNLVCCLLLLSSVWLVVVVINNMYKSVLLMPCVDLMLLALWYSLFVSEGLDQRGW